MLDNFSPCEKTGFDSFLLFGSRSHSLVDNVWGMWNLFQFIFVSGHETNFLDKETTSIIRLIRDDSVSCCHIFKQWYVFSFINGIFFAYQEKVAISAQGGGIYTSDMTLSCCVWHGSIAFTSFTNLVGVWKVKRLSTFVVFQWRCWMLFLCQSTAWLVGSAAISPYIPPINNVYNIRCNQQRYWMFSHVEDHSVSDDYWISMQLLGPGLGDFQPDQTYPCFSLTYKYTSAFL